ncbi:MAG: WG repeat-containing protein [Terracidiphilus sp.]
MFCPGCGAQLQEGKKFCVKCGRKFGAAEADAAPVEGSAAPIEAEAPVAPAPRAPLSSRSKLMLALGAVVVVLCVVGWWWFHRPAPAYKVEDPGLYPFTEFATEGKAGIRLGFVDLDGKVAIPAVWEGVAFSDVSGQAVAFNEGLCGVLKDGKWGYIDKSGKLAIPPQFDSAGPFVEGLARVGLGNRWGFIDKKGQYAVNPQFYEAGYFHDGLAPVRGDGGWGYIDRSGAFAIQPHFNSTDSDGFSEGLAWARTTGKFGYIDRTGAFAIAPQFDGAASFSDGLAAVIVGGKWGYIDRSGKLRINPQFDRATMFTGGRAAVTVAGHSGIIDRRGKFQVNPGEFNFDAREGEIQVATTPDGLGLLGMDGKWILKPSKGLDTPGPIYGKAVLGRVHGMVTPISLQGKVLAGWFKGATVDSLAQASGNLESAWQSLGQLNSAEMTYTNTYTTATNNSGFTASLAKLGPASGTPDADHAGLIDAALASGTKNGYQFAISIPGGEVAGKQNSQYFIVAKPVAGQLGPSLCTDASGAIHFANPPAECTLQSPVMGD